MLLSTYTAPLDRRVVNDEPENMWKLMLWSTCLDGMRKCRKPSSMKIGLRRLTTVLEQFSDTFTAVSSSCSSSSSGTDVTLVPDDDDSDVSDKVSFTACIRRKSLEFYDTRNVITVFTRCRHLSQKNLVDAIPFYFLIYFNRIFPLMPTLPKMSSSQRVHIHHSRIIPYLDHFIIADVSIHQLLSPS